MTLDNFIKEINGELSQDCKIPFTIPKKSLMRSIDWAKKWFYKHYEYAVEETYIYIPLTSYDTAQYKKDRSICLDDTVVDVHDIFRVGGAMLHGDFSFDRLVQEDMLKLKTMMGQNGSYQMDYFVVGQVYYDMMKQLLNHPISFEYNPNNHKFRILGEDPMTNLVLLINKKIDEEFLFEDQYFFRYMVAEAKINLGRIAGTIEMPLIGNAKINFGELKDEGKEEQDYIKEEIKNDEGTDYFFSS